MRNKQMELVTRMSDLAASASGWLVPKTVRDVVDRTLVDVACVTHGGLPPLAAQLGVDVPALDAWRSLGVPNEFRGRLTAMAMWPPMPSLPALPTLGSLPGRRLAA